MNNDEQQPTPTPTDEVSYPDPIGTSTATEAIPPSAPPPAAPIPADVPLAEPLSSMDPPSLDTPPAKAPKKKFPVLITAIIVGAVVLLGGGTVAAYNLYYQNPAKIIADALSTTLAAKTATYSGTFDINDDGTTINVTFDGKNAGDLNGTVNVTADISFDSTKLTVKGSGLVDSDGNLYFKLQGIKDLVNNLISTSGTSIDITPFDALIAKLEDKWVKISADDLKDYSADYSKAQTCVADALKTFNTDSAAKKEIETVYINNQFLTIDKKLGSKSIGGTGSLGYAITIDNTKAETFGKALEETRIGKQLKTCEPSSSADTTEATDTDNKAVITAELWVSRFGHNVTQLNVTSTEDKNTAKLSLSPVFNKPVSVAAPTDTLTLKELASDIQTAYTDYFVSLTGIED